MSDKENEDYYSDVSTILISDTEHTDSVSTTRKRTKHPKQVRSPLQEIRPVQSRRKKKSSAPRAAEDPIGTSHGDDFVAGRFWTWCGTYFNYTDETLSWWRELLSNPIGVKYTTFGKETCPTTGRKHLQWFLQFSRKVSFNQLRTLFGNSPNVRMFKCNGSPASNKEYCQKDGDFEEFGQSPGQGRRTDLDGLTDSIREGMIKSVADIIDSEHLSTFVKYHKGIERVLQYKMVSRDSRTKGLWFSGPTATGKSRTAFTLANQLGSYYFKDPNTNWWDLYMQQKTVIVEEFKGGMLYSYVLQLCDRYPMLVQNKGGYAQFNSPLIIFTSSKTISETFVNATTEKLDQLQRRVLEIRFPSTEDVAAQSERLLQTALEWVNGPLEDVPRERFLDAPQAIAPLFHPPPPQFNRLRSEAIPFPRREKTTTPSTPLVRTCVSMYDDSYDEEAWTKECAEGFKAGTSCTDLMSSQDD